MRTPEVTELLRRLKQGRLPPNADAYTLAAEVECLEAEVEFYKRHGQEMTDVGNGLYRAIVARLEPHLPAGSRDLEWDVLPETVGALAKRAETAEVRYVASQDALAECMGELKEWHTLRAWGGTPEIVEQWIKGQQVRIHHAQGIEESLAQAEARVAELEAQNARLREALWFLLMGYEGLGGDMHNNAPQMAKAALADTKGTP